VQRRAVIRGHDSISPDCLSQRDQRLRQAIVTGRAPCQVWPFSSVLI
jgi:hypothetical protein